MKHITPPKTLLALFTLALILSACDFPSSNTEDQVALAAAQTQVALTQTALASAGGEGVPPANTEDPPSEPPATPTPTLTPSITPSPTQTLSPTLEKPMVSVSVDTNCRTGPGKQYDIIGALLVNETAEVAGKAVDGQYWIIKNPDRNGECWLWAYYASVSGPTDAVPVVTQPPTPTPQFVWEGNWDTVNASPDTPFAILMSMNIAVNGRNFSAVMTIPGMDPVLLSGTISDDWLSVSGSYSGNAEEGTFKFYAVGTNQFNGNSKNGETRKWCGGRNGAGMPDPCYKE